MRQVERPNAARTLDFRFASTPSIPKALLRTLSIVGLEHPQQSQFTMSLRQVTKRKRSPIYQCFRTFTSTSSRTNQDNATDSVAASQYSAIKVNPSPNSPSYKSSQLSSRPSRTPHTLAPPVRKPPPTSLMKTCERPSHQPANRQNYKEADNRRAAIPTAQHPSLPKP